jgi:hypothetical protein
MALKDNPLQYRISWVKKDLKRVTILLVISLLASVASGVTPVIPCHTWRVRPRKLKQILT